MKYAKYDIRTQFHQETILPRFKGSMLRGAMGHALKATICAVRVKECESCILRPTCLYARILKSSPTTKKRQARPISLTRMCWKSQEKQKPFSQKETPSPFP